MAEAKKTYQPSASTVRARFILEMAAGMGASEEQPFREPEVFFKAQRGAGGPFLLSASSTLDGLTRVVAGDLDLAFLNPSAALAVAYRGTGSAFTAPQPVRAVTVLPSRDQCLFAVRAETGFTHIEDIARARYPLKLSLRGLDQHWLHFMLDDIFAAAGFSLAHLKSWGGEVRKEGHIPHPGTPRFESLMRGEVDAIFDEGVHSWADSMVPAGMTVLHLGEDTVAKLEAMGYRRDYLRKKTYPTLPEDILTLDFSGWPVFVREDADDDLVRHVCAGLEARRDEIPWEGGGPLPLERMCRDVAEAPLGIPLHPAAERFWSARGYL
jgi:TRAP-type uncharacterized transport system substrate-binding protein